MQNYERAIFAGGCFWCMVNPFDILPGVQRVTSGYIGGQTTFPTYEEVKSQQSGHYEAVEIVFDPDLVSYETLLSAFWMQIDPTDDGGQFHDRGPSYRTAIFYVGEAQRLAAELSRAQLAESGRFPRPIVTPILPATVFYPAEDYHQDYYRKEPEHYKSDRKVSGRDEFIRQHWGDEYWQFMERWSKE